YRSMIGRITKSEKVAEVSVITAVSISKEVVCNRMRVLLADGQHPLHGCDDCNVDTLHLQIRTGALRLPGEQSSPVVSGQEPLKRDQHAFAFAVPDELARNHPLNIAVQKAHRLNALGGHRCFVAKPS